MAQVAASSHLQGLVWKALLLGIATGFLLQVMTVAAYYTILIKIWDQTSPNSSLMPYQILVIWSEVNIGMPIVIGLTLFYYSRTKSGVLYLRKIKLDQNVETPAGSNSIPWTSRKLVAVGIYFLFGYNLGLNTVVLFIGQSIPWTPFLKTVGVNFVLSWIIIKCFDWVEHNDKEEEETMHLYAPMIDPVIL